MKQDEAEIRRRTLAVLAVATAIGSIGLAAGGTAGALLAASVTQDLHPRTEGLGEVAMGVAAGAGAPIAGVVVSVGGLSTLLLAGAGTATLTFYFVRVMR
ncbi:MAG: hypothetical protein H0V83_07385 [Rubrobacter sp.]|nr:hypothetical protein [Rubrobacter sp.]